VERRSAAVLRRMASGVKDPIIKQLLGFSYMGKKKEEMPTIDDIRLKVKEYSLWTDGDKRSEFTAKLANTAGYASGNESGKESGNESDPEAKQENKFGGQHYKRNVSFSQGATGVDKSQIV
jgi:hypothetical protein